MTADARFVVLGGGIAGVSCVLQLRETLGDGPASVTLISASPTLKLARNVKTLSRARVTFDITEENEAVLAAHGVRFVQGEVVGVDVAARVVRVRARAARDSAVAYDQLCVCTGAVPRIVAPHPSVIGLRDTESVQDLARRLEQSRRVVVVGSGGVALEIVHAVRAVPVIWVVRGDTLGSSYFDEGAARFFIATLAHVESAQQPRTTGDHKRRRAELDCARAPVRGAALGPHWVSALSEQQKSSLAKMWPQSSLRVVYDAQVTTIGRPDDGWPARVVLSSGDTINCDVVVSAIGVEPFTAFLGEQFRRASDGGVQVDRRFRTSVPGVLAAGDACTIDRGPGASPTWFQMRLWTQAREMGMEAALSMVHEQRRGRVDADWLASSFSFELFAHVTNFFGFKVVLLGLYNGQTLGTDFSVHVRSTPGQEYVKAVVRDHRLVGAVLIGETDLEEAFENLILNRTDLSAIEHVLLDPDVDLEDYFD